MKRGIEFLLIYIAFIPISIFLIVFVMNDVGAGIALPLFGYALTTGSFVAYKYFPNDLFNAKLALAVGTVAFWLFQIADAYSRSAFEPVLIVFFILSSYILWIISIEKRLKDSKA